MTALTRTAFFGTLLIGVLAAVVALRPGGEAAGDSSPGTARERRIRPEDLVPPSGPAGRDVRAVRAHGDSAPVSWRLEEELTVESPENEPFVGLLVDAHGRLFARSTRPHRIHVYDAGGAPVRTFPDSGAGARETLEDVRGMTWGPGGELWIVEGDRFAVFDTTGRFRRQVPRRSNANARRWKGAGFDAAGRLYDKGFAGGAHDPALFRIEGDGAVADTVRLPFVRPRYFAPGPETRIRGVPTGTDTAGPDSTRPGAPDRPPRAAAVATAGYPIPHSPEAIWAFDPQGWLWVARTDAYSVYRRRLDGDTVLAIRREILGRPVTPAEKLEIQRRMERRGEVPDTARIPSRKPVLESLHVDRDGRLWVRLTSDPSSPTVFDVYGRDGSYLAHVEPGVRITAPAPVAHGDTLDYVGPRPGAWPRPEPGDFAPITNHVVRARLVPSDALPSEADVGGRAAPGDRPAGEDAAVEPGEEPPAGPDGTARRFWRAWARSDTAAMLSHSNGLVAFTPGRRARLDSVTVADAGRPGEGVDRTAVATRLWMSAGNSTFVVPFRTTLLRTDGGWRVDGLATTRALALAYTGVMVEQLRDLGRALDRVRTDSTGAAADTGAGGTRC